MSRKFLRSLGLFLLLAHTLGCAVAIPVDQIHSPQTLGKHGLDISMVAGSSLTIGPKELGSQNFSSNGGSVIEGYRLAYGITENLDFEGEIFLSFFAGATSSLGLKYQWLGDSFFSNKTHQWTSSVRARYLSASGFEDSKENEQKNDTIFKGVFVEKMDGTGYSLSNSFGYNVAEWFGVYMGAQILSMTLDYRYRDGDSTGPLTSGKRSVTGYGPFLGFRLNTTGKSFRFIYSLGVEYTNIPGEFSDDRVWARTASSGLTLAFQF